MPQRCSFPAALVRSRERRRRPRNSPGWRVSKKTRCFASTSPLREAVANAILHGNRQDESKPVEVRIIVSEAGLIVTVRDQCACFQPAEVADPTAAENLLKASGRGILLMRTFMDEVVWERHPGGGTIVRMIKKR